MTGTVLILGANGRFGRHAETAFQAAGWTVRRYDRRTDTPETAAPGSDVVVNGMNPPDYRDWDREVPRITALSIAAARASGATLIVPGNVYNFGSQPAPWGPETPHAPITGKGSVRSEMERAYRAATEDHGLRVVILRAGDFIDDLPEGTWLGEGILRDLKRGRVAYPGRTDTPHAWAYLPDLARAAVALAEKRQTLPAYADIPFPGHTLTGAALADAIETAAGRPLKRVRFPWWMLRLLSPVSPAASGMREMRYLWDTPHSLDDTAFRAVLPDFAFTPLDEALVKVVAASQGRSISTQTSRWSDDTRSAPSPTSA